MGCLVRLQGLDNMDSGLSPQDKKDLDKFIKFFALKVNIQNGAPVSCWGLGRVLVVYGVYQCRRFEILVTDILRLLWILLYDWRITVSNVLCVDCPGDCPSSSWREDRHSLVLIADWLWLGEMSLPLNLLSLVVLIRFHWRSSHLCSWLPRLVF